MKIRARLRGGRTVELAKQCACLDTIHTEPHWLHADRLHRESNWRLWKRRNYRGFASEEAARLRTLIYEMESRGIVKLIREDLGEQETD